MPVRGRKPKPDEIRKLGGRPHKKKENIIDFPVPDALKDLSPDVRLDIEEVWEHLIVMNVALPVDRGAFERYIRLRRMQEDAEQDMEERGVILRKGTARERFNPSFRVFQIVLVEMLKLEEQFGLTPSARRRVPFPAKKKEGGYAAQRGSKTA